MCDREKDGDEGEGGDLYFPGFYVKVHSETSEYNF